MSGMADTSNPVTATASLIGRSAYLRRLHEVVNPDQVTVLQGIRRCGKSSILRLYEADLLKNGVKPANIFHKRLDEFTLPLTTTADQLARQIFDALKASDTSSMFYVFLDEIQDVPGWERVVRGLQTREGVTVLITGSNSHLLSSDLATLLAGRTISVPVYPLSFAEYRTFAAARAVRLHLPQRSEDDLLADYLRFGGMPSLFSLAHWDVETIGTQLSSVYDTVILQDVVERLQIRDVALLRNLVTYLFSTAGNLFSTRKIVGALTSMGRKTSAETIENYCDALKQAYILTEVTQTGVGGKRLLSPLRKFYPVDTGLRNLATGFALRDVGFQLENMVAIELLRRGWNLHVGAGEKDTGARTTAESRNASRTASQAASRTPSRTADEIDFVANRFDQRCYIQVCETLAGEKTLERELAPLRALHNSFPKMIITLDRFHQGVTEDGIRIIPAAEWLLQGQDS
jgi:predicted AAA+ superfamily ATPase